MLCPPPSHPQVRCGNKSRAPWLRSLLAPTRLEHGDVGLMCLAASQIIYRCGLGGPGGGVRFFMCVVGEGSREKDC